MSLRATLLLVCLAPASALAADGVAHVYTVVDGFEGDIGPGGRRDVNGWKVAGGRWQSRVLPHPTSASAI